MSRILVKCLSVVLLLGACGLLVNAHAAMAPPTDSVSGKLTVTGGPFSAEFKNDVSGSVSAPNTKLQIDYYEWNGKAWVLLPFTTVVDLAGGVGPLTYSETRTFTSGKKYQAELFLLRGNPPAVAVQSTSNSIVAP